MNSPRRALLSLGVLLAACGEHEGPAPPDPGPFAIVIVATPPSDTVTAEPSQRLEVALRSQKGGALTSAAVRFTAVVGIPAPLISNMLVAPSAGSFSTEMVATTDAAGKVTALVRFGQRTGAGAIAIAVPELGIADTIRFTVAPGRPASVRLQPRDTALSPSAGFPIRGQVFDRLNNPRPDPVTFSAASAPAGAGAVSTSGQVTGLAPGRLTVEGVAGALTDTMHVSILPVGTIAAFDEVRGHFVLTNLDGTGVRNITQAPVIPGPELEPAWSPDGTEIVFTEGGFLTILRVATGELSSLPALPLVGYVSPFWPTFSADGGTIYFSVFGGALARLARINRDGTNFAFLTNGPFDSRASAAPNGKRLAFHVQGGAILRLFELATGAILDFVGPGVYPEWAPDGGRIAYFTTAAELRIVNADGTNARTLAPAGRYYTQPISWSPDGRWIMLRGDRIELLGVASDLNGLELRTQLPASLTAPIWRPK